MADPADFVQRCTENRLSAIVNANGASFFSYDIHGRVKAVMQQINQTGFSKNIMVEYAYAPLTGRIDTVIYQRNNEKEQFWHTYGYDNDNRLVDVKISRNGIEWLKAAAYDYYQHGPLKSTELGEHIQKIEYIYNINGWLKAINNPTGSSTEKETKGFATDVFAEVMNYYKGDYQRTATGFEPGTNNAPQTGTALGNHATDYFSGMVSSAITRNRFDFTASSSTPDLLAQTYRYDVLGRLTSSYTELANGTTFGGFSGANAGAFDIAMTYDPNGNIKTNNRLLADGVSKLDMLTYKYATTTNARGKTFVENNKLQHINDQALKDISTIDIDDQGAYNSSNPNYRYDAKGRLVSSPADGAQTIVWSPYDKVERVVPTDATKPTIEYTYTPMQQRQMKRLRYPSGLIDETYYVYDASGQLMSHYNREVSATGTETTMQEGIVVYGSSKLGMYEHNQTLASGATLQTTTADKLRFELTDHLGNIRAVVSGLKKTDGKANIISMSDYYPGGMLMPGRNYNADRCNFGYNGKLKSPEIGEGIYTAKFWEFDSRTIRRWNLDPKPLKGVSEYACFANNPVLYNDPNGDVVPVLAAAGLAGIGGFFVDAAVQYSVNAAFGDNIWEALSKVDWHDASVSGAVSFSTFGAGAEATIAKSAANALTRRAISIATASTVIQANSDVKINFVKKEVNVESFTSGTKSYNDFIKDGLLDFAGQKSASSFLKGVTKSTGSDFKNAVQKNNMSPNDIELYKKVNKVANSSIMKTTTEATTDFAQTVVGKAMDFSTRGGKGGGGTPTATGKTPRVIVGDVILGPATLPK